MKRALLKTGMIFGIPTLIGLLIGTFLRDLVLYPAFGFLIGLTIFAWILIVKIRHFVRSVQQQYARQPDNHS